MILYNVTVQIEESVHAEWLEWMKEKHVPDVMASNCFVENKICKLLSDDSPNTYSFQYYCDSMADLEKYQKDHSPALQKEHGERFANKFVAFRSVLEII